MKFFLVTLVCFLLGFSVSLFKRHEKLKTKYEYHIILTNDSVFVFDRYDKQIGNYKSTNPKEKFDSILLLNNL